MTDEQETRTDPFDDPDLEMMGITLRAAKEVRDRLAVDEEFYVSIAPSAISHHRDYYLYGILDQVERACLAFVRLHQFLDELNDESDLEGERARIERNMLHTAQTEQAVWTRKLTEALVEVILFSKTNRHPYYGHLMVIGLLEAYRKANADLEHYHGGRSANVDKMVRLFTRSAHELEAKIDSSKVWYASQRKSGKIVSPPFKDLLDQALLVGNRHEKLALGLSYANGYGRASRAMHWTIGSQEPRTSREVVRATQQHLLLLCHNVILRSKRLIRMRSKQGDAAALARLYRGSKYPAELYKGVTKKSVSKGDFVVVQGELAEVLGSSQSQFGYKSYRVQFLSRAPMPDILEDWYPATELRILKRVGDLRLKVRGRLIEAGATPPNRIPAQAVRDSMLNIWNNRGLKEAVLGDEHGAAEKMRAFLRDSPGNGD